MPNGPKPLTPPPPQPPPPMQQISVELRDAESEGVYSNLVLISHTPSEFILDFARILPGARKARVHARIVMAPQYVKALYNALEQNIKRFEEQFGPIPALGTDMNVTPRHIGFTTPPPADAEPGASR